MALTEIAASGSAVWETAIIAIPLDSPGRVEFVGWGAAPNATPLRGGLAWIETNADAHQVMTARPDGDQQPFFGLPSVGGGWRLTNVACSDQVMVASLVGEVDGAGNAWLTVWNPVDHSLIAVIDTGSDWAAPSVAGSVVTWGNGSGGGPATIYRWDAATGSLMSLWETPGLSLPLAGATGLTVPALTADGSISWRFLDWDD